MIKVSSETRPKSINRTIKHFITCPQCLAVDWFFNLPSKTCPQCGFTWGDVTILFNDIDARKQFHKNGEINA